MSRKKVRKTKKVEFYYCTFQNMRVYYDYTELSKTQFEGDIKMTDLRILHLAYVTAVNNWAKECEHATADPNNSYSKARERRAWNELKEIEVLIKEEESK